MSRARTVSHKSQDHGGDEVTVKPEFAKANHLRNNDLVNAEAGKWAYLGFAELAKIYSIRGGHSVEFATIDQMRQGFDRDRIDQIAQMALLTKKEIAQLLGVSERHLYNASAKPLTVLQSEHLLHLETLFSLGLILFDHNRKVFSLWLNTPKQSLALPQTGYSVDLPDAYQLPTLNELFAPVDDKQISRAIERTMSTTQRLAAGPPDTYPTPLSLLDTATGISLVGAILGRIDAGVFS